MKQTKKRKQYRYKRFALWIDPNDGLILQATASVKGISMKAIYEAMAEYYFASISEEEMQKISVKFAQIQQNLPTD